MFDSDLLKAISKTSKKQVIDGIAQHSDIIVDYKIDTFLRLSHFLGQAAHETDGFRTLEEYASGANYEGRKDLGNTQPGDGRRYKGRGIFQLTGRANYKKYGNLLNIDLETMPEKASESQISVMTACQYWKNLNLSLYADKDDLITITKKINGGTNGLESRKIYVEKAKVIIAESDMNLLVAKRDDASQFISWIQNKLNKKGYNLKTDGIYGRNTESAVSDFQSKNNINNNGIIYIDTLKKLRE